MIKIENLYVTGIEPAVRGMRNPMNSWDKSDSGFVGEDGHAKYFNLGPNDFKLAKSLSEGGGPHAKYRRMIQVYMDITAPLYWWKELDTYKVGTVANSCSTMHKIHAKEFTLDDFSHEHLISDPSLTEQIEMSISDYEGYKWFAPKEILECWIIPILNKCREKFLETKDKRYWWQMIQLLPSSYNQKRTIMLNYEVLANMYKSRKNHKLDEWRTFCDFIETLPYSELITGKVKTDG